MTKAGVLVPEVARHEARPTGLNSGQGSIVPVRRSASARLLPPILACLLAGCGGSKAPTRASSRGVGTVAVLTDASGAPTARRVRLTLSTFDGLNDVAPVGAKAASLSGPTRVDLDGLPSGTLHLHGDLLDASGAILSSMDALLDGDKATAIEAVAGQAPASVDVVPKVALVPMGGARRFFAVPRTSSGRVVFVPTEGIAWSSADAGVATVAGGRAQGVAEGATSVSAGVGGVSGTAQAVVNAIRRSKWTVLVYLNAANDLAQYSLANFDAMEQAAGNPEVRIVVQWKTGTQYDSLAPFSGTRRYLVRPGDGAGIASTLVDDMGQGVDMGAPRSLAEFVAWGRANFPSERTMLVVWNHGNGWGRSALARTRGVSYDDEFGTAVQAWELGAALGDAPLDVVAFDASLMQMVEVAYELRAHAAYVVGSEESPPAEGYPYDKILGTFRDAPDASTRDLTRTFVDSTLSEPQYAGRKITQSVLDTARLGGLAASVDAFARRLLANRVSLGELVPAVRDEAQAYSPTATRVYRDLYDVADRIGRGTTDPALAQTAAGAQAAVLSAVVWEGHNAQSPGSHGVSIDFSGGAAFAGVKSDYANLGLAHDTRWDEWLAVAP